MNTEKVKEWCLTVIGLLVGIGAVLWGLLVVLCYVLIPVAVVGIAIKYIFF